MTATTPASTVLLIEDSPSDAVLIHSHLALVDGWVVLHATTLSAGLAILGHTEVHAVLLDLGLPDTDRLEGLRRLREAHNVPVVVLTGHRETDFGADALRHGAQDFLSKDAVDAAALDRSLRYARERHEHAIALTRAQLRLSQYARAVAHDIRTPLATIRGFAELIKVGEQGRGAPESRVAAFADRITAATRRLTTMTSDLLVDAESVSGDVPVDLTATARWAVELLTNELEQADADVTVLHLPTVVGHRATLRRVFTNLIANAIHHVDVRPLRIRIVGESHEDGSWDVVVEDNGTRVDADLVARGAPLDPDALQPTGGHGHGLRAVASTVIEHDGSTWLSTTADGGLRIAMRFPRSRVQGGGQP